MNVDITGAKIFLKIPTGIPGLGDFALTETIVVGWIVVALTAVLCFWLGRDLKLENISKRQAVAEMLVETASNLVHSNAGSKNADKLIPFVATIFSASALSNLIGLLGFRSPTADMSTEIAWAAVVFVVILSTKLKTSGVLGYIKGLFDPIPIFAPLNVLSEFATPFSMACRHFGNIVSGVVINALIYAALAAASAALFGLLPGALGRVLAQVPILSVGIPAFTSFYFDWFSGLCQALIFTMLTLIFTLQGMGDD